MSSCPSSYPQLIVLDKGLQDLPVDHALRPQVYYAVPPSPESGYDIWGRRVALFFDGVAQRFAVHKDVQSEVSSSADEQHHQVPAVLNTLDKASALGTRAAVGLINLGDRVGSYVRHNPMSTRWMLRGLVLTGFAAGSTRVANAAAYTPGPIFDPIRDQFFKQTASWMGNSLGLAENIFMSIALLVLIWSFFQHLMKGHGPSGIISGLVTQWAAFGIPFLILKAGETFLATTTTGGGLLDQNTGLPSTIAFQITGTKMPGSIDAIFFDGVQVGWTLLQASFSVFASSHFSIFNFDPTELLIDLVFFILGLVICVAIIFAFTIIAAEVLMAELQLCFALPLGAFTLGFSAANATAAIAMGYWQAVLRTIVQFVACIAAVSICEGFGHTWATDITTKTAALGHLTAANTLGTADGGALKMMLSYAAASLVLVMIVKRLPALAGSAMTGSPSLSGAQVFNPGAVAALGAAAVGGAAGGAISNSRSAGSGGNPLMAAAGAIGGAFSGAINGAADQAINNSGGAGAGGGSRSAQAAMRQFKNASGPSSDKK